MITSQQVTSITSSITDRPNLNGIGKNNAIRCIRVIDFGIGFGFTAGFSLTNRLRLCFLKCFENNVVLSGAYTSDKTKIKLKQDRMPFM